MVVDEGLKDYGESMRQNRQVLGYSVRDAADLAGVSKNTILRLEAGLPVQKSTRVKLCRAYGMVAREPSPDRAAEGANYRLQKREGLIWIPTRVTPDGHAEAYEHDRPLTDAERQRLGWHRLATQFGRPLRCRREGSRFIPFLLELYAPSDVTADPSGERFIYVLRGSVRVRVGDESFEMTEGEAASYDSTLPNGLEPLEPVMRGDVPPLVMQILMP